MIGFMPEIYTDELLYSMFARYYERSGYMAYIFAAEDLFQNKNERPDVEFINRLMFLEITPEELNNPHIGESIKRLNRKKVYTNAKPGTKTRDWNEIVNIS